MAAAAESFPPADPAMGAQTIIDDRYRVLGRLGGGGMGEVFEVEHVRLERRFALKVVRPELAGHPELTRRFDREVRAVAKLHSDYVVSIVDSGNLSDGRPYFVMERLVGQDLRELLATTPQLPVPRAVNLAIDVCLGLEAAHVAGLVHCDLKPENLFVTRADDGRDRCKVLDFGIVKLAEQEQTRPDALVGTARYMAPEQIGHDAVVDARADLFALGVILYRCLSGQHPFAADSLERVLFRIMNHAPEPLCQLAPHVPSALATVVARAMAKAPSERPASALELARSLADFTSEPRPIEPHSDWQVRTHFDVRAATLAGASDPTPALGEPPPASVSRRSLHRFAFGAAAVLAVAVAGIFLARLPSAGSGTSGRPAPTPRATSPAVPASALDAPTNPGSVAQPDTATVPADVSASSRSSATRKSIGVPSPRNSPEVAAASATTSASATAAPLPSLNWFDPRNPYAK